MIRCDNNLAYPLHTDLNEALKGRNWWEVYPNYPVVQRPASSPNDSLATLRVARSPTLNSNVNRISCDLDIAMASSLARALSPSLASVSASFGTSKANATLARHQALLAANSLAELVAMVPIDYREVLRPYLVAVSSNAEKRIRMKESLAKLLDFKGRDPVQFPASITTKVHETQLTKEFASTEAGRQFATASRDAAHAYKVVLLDNDIAAKQANVAQLDSALSTSRFLDDVKNDLKNRYDVLKLTSKLPVFVAKTGGEEGELDLKEWKVSPTVQSGFVEILQDCVAFALRAIALVEAREIASHVKLVRKKELKESVDVEMADATKPGPSVQSLIDKAVSAAEKRLAKKVSRQHNDRSPTYQTMTGLLRGSVVVETGEQSRRGPRRYAPVVLGASSCTDADPWFAEVGQESRAVRQQGHRSQRRSSRQEALSGRQDQRFEGRRPQEIGQGGQGWACEGKEEQQVGGTSTSYLGDTTTAGNLLPLRYDVPSSYPDWLLTVPYPTAINYIILNTPVNIVLASQFKDSIHLSPGVEIPREIEQQLSVGMRFMFHSPRNSKLIKEAWQDFERRIRWRLFFSFRNEDDSSYDPDFDIQRTSDRVPPRLPHYLEIGLRRGRSFVSDTISKIPDEEVKDPYRSLQPSPRQIGEFLAKNDYIVTGTDKNLGIAVSRREWIEEKCTQLLEDRNNYTRLSQLHAYSIFAHQCKEALAVARDAEDLVNGKQIAEFLRSQVTTYILDTDGSLLFRGNHKVPIFYGIPKIHKLPVKMRPIIPCHSAIQNPAAKFCSKKLKPLVKAAPSIIHGTKDLAIKLSKLKIDRHRQKYIVTGDVVAYYPNIPIQHCLDIVAEQYDNHHDLNRGGAGELDEATLREALVFHKCLKLGNLNLVTKFKDNYYRQTVGLAMGVADSPDLANLYGWYFEEKCNILNHPDVPLYGRYIDDCAAIVYASSEQDAINKVSIVQFDNCVIEWSASAVSQPFLDMTLYIDREGRVQHMPYRKARSHQERVPWISHHPLDVKRGTFVGEMSRLATLSSLFTHYKDAIDALVGLYIKRGYPSDLVMKWMKDNFKTRWEKRINEGSNAEREHSDVLVLKSEFNTSWNYFSAHELGETVLGYWRTWMNQADSDQFDAQAGYYRFDASIGGLEDVDRELCSPVRTSDGLVMMPDIRKLDILNRRMIVSRKRTRNIFDLTSLWKKTALKRFEEAILEEENKDVEIPMINDDDDGLGPYRNRPQPGDLEYVAYPNPRLFV